jgi:DNA-binding response OmpR family regulator
MRVLLVEDDVLIGSGVRAGMLHAGFTVDWAQDGIEAQLALRAVEYQLLVLDLGLPRLSGMELLSQLRAGGNCVPVLVLTARDAVSDKVSVLEGGADDYLGKPFDLAELVARCRALIRRSQGRAVEAIEYGRLRLDPIAQTASLDGVALPLTRREWTLLHHLLAHQGEMQSRTRLEDTLYSWNMEVESNAIQVHISNIRKKLGWDLIRTVRGFGYVIDKR